MAKDDNNQKATVKSLAKSASDIFIAIIFYSMVMMVFINAVLRYGFNAGWPASEEISRFLFVWITMIGSVLAYLNHMHIGVDLIISRVKGKPLKIMTILGHIVVIAVLALLFYGGIRHMCVAYGVPSPATGIPMGVLILSLLICSGSMLIITFIRLMNCFKAAEPPKEG